MRRGSHPAVSPALNLRHVFNGCARRGFRFFFGAGLASCPIWQCSAAICCNLNMDAVEWKTRRCSELLTAQDFPFMHPGVGVSDRQVSVHLGQVRTSFLQRIQISIRHKHQPSIALVKSSPASYAFYFDKIRPNEASTLLGLGR